MRVVAFARVCGASTAIACRQAGQESRAQRRGIDAGPHAKIDARQASDAVEGLLRGGDVHDAVPLRRRRLRRRPATVSVRSRNPACSVTVSPVRTASHEAAAGLRNTLSGRSTSSGSAAFRNRAGVTAPARNASTPKMDNASSRPLMRASTSTIGLATATSGSCARRRRKASRRIRSGGRALRGPRFPTASPCCR